jgi:N-acetylglucosamine-6-sulfatase
MIFVRLAAPSALQVVVYNLSMTIRSGRFIARGGLLGILACLPSFFLAGCSGLGIAQGAQPNIIFVLADDLDYASTQKMPEINSLLVEGGTSFENAFISYPLCCPSRATILTGLYAHNHDVRGNEPPQGGFEKFRSEGLEENTIATRLQKGGYRTAFFGKYLNNYPGEQEASYVPPGWDEWYGKLVGQTLYDYKINENGEVVSYGSETEDFFTDVLSGQATDFVRRAATEDQPFFAYVAPTAPHGPATPAERHEGAFAEEEPLRPPSFDEEDVSDKPPWIRDSDRLSNEAIAEIDDLYRQRLESMLAVDEMVASLVEELEAAGELENTYLFFASDNGYEQGEHRIKGGKSRPYEESAHVPFFVRGPGVPAGSTVQRLVLNTDLASTFGELAGTEFPADGRSIVPLLRGKAPSWRSAVLLEGFGKGSRAYGAVRTETYKYIEYDNGERELYDLEADPYELESIHETADASLVEDLETTLDKLRSCVGVSCHDAEDALYPLGVCRFCRFLEARSSGSRQASALGLRLEPRAYRGRFSSVF